MGLCCSTPQRFLADPNSVPTFPQGRLQGRCVRVIDGDTLVVILAVPIPESLPGTGCCFPTALLQTHIRLMGIDSPESRPAQNAPLRDLEKQAAAAVKERLRRWVEGQDVIVEILKHDKYGGRVVANVWQRVDNEQRNIGQEMLRRQWVRPYNGERKVNWTTSELQHILISTST